MRRWKLTIAAVIAIAIIILSTLLAANWIAQQTKPQFYVGVEFAFSYNNGTSIENLVGQLKALVDKVKDYTNLFVIGTPDISFNQTALNECCDYITKAGLNFIVLFTDQRNYTAENNPFSWIRQAQQKYGDKFIAIYRFDEPGGNQLDNGISQVVYNAGTYSESALNYAATDYENEYHAMLQDWSVGEKIFTADYGLQWFDYRSGFDCVLTELGNNQSRQISIGLCRGAANAQGKDWGAIITWTYTGAPYIENGSQLYSDLTLSYDEGAKYDIVFDYPQDANQYGILTNEHFEALQSFWSYIQKNPQMHGADAGKVAYVLPENYGFGCRNVNDTIWGLWNSDSLSNKVWGDVNKLIGEYGSGLNIVYNEPPYNNTYDSSYSKLYFWNQTIS